MVQAEATRTSGARGRRRSPRRASVETPAYQGGWRDGRFEPVETFERNPNLASWEGVDRLAYYRGYREGLRVRKMLGREA